MRLTRSGGSDFEPRDRQIVERPRHALDDYGQRVGDRSARVAALAERPRPAEHQQAAASPLDELSDHPKLIAGERARLDAPEDDPAIREQLVARLGKPSGQLLGAVDIEAHVLVVRGPLQRLTSRFLSSTTARRMNFISGRGSPSKYSSFSRPIDDLDERLALVVLGNDFARPGAILNLKTRGPASEAVNRTRTAAGSPSAGSFTSCDPTIFPPSSTSSVTDSPGEPGLRHDDVDHAARCP